MYRQVTVACYWWKFVNLYTFIRDGRPPCILKIEYDHINIKQYEKYLIYIYYIAVSAVLYGSVGVRNKIEYD